MGHFARLARRITTYINYMKRFTMASPHLGNGKNRLLVLFAEHKYVAYSFIFLIMLVLMHARHVHWGTGLIWAIDGVEQQYPIFVAQGRWLRELMDGLLSGQPSIPQWTMDAGYGTDYISALLPSIGNPFNMLSVFATTANAEFLLTVAVVLQLYFAGIVFLQYCGYRQFEAFSSVVGAAIYVFSGYTVLVFSQLFMLYPLVLGPLVLRGVDYIFDKRSPVIFVVSQALCALYGITMVYAVNLLLIAYCIVRYLLLDERKSILGFARWFLKIVGCIILGLLIASVLIVPSVLMLMGQGRLGLERPLDFLYETSYYLSAFTGLLYPSSVGADCFYGYAPAGILSILALFIVREKNDKESIILITMFIVMIVILLLPLLGRVFNGFAYPNNRWVWALSLVIGLSAAYALPRIECLDDAKLRALFIACSAFGFAEAMLLSVRFSPYFGFALLIFILLAIAYIALLRKRKVNLWRLAVLFSVPLWCAPVFWYWSVLLPSEDMMWDETYRITELDSPTRMLAKIDWEDGKSYHYDGTGYDSRRNACLALGIPGASFYSSYYNSLVDKYHDALGLTSSDLNFSFVGFQGRTALDVLAGVKYFLAAEGIDEKIPSVYSEIVDQDYIGETNYYLLETASPLPIAFKYDKYISEDSFNGLSMIQRQEALLQGMIVEHGGASAESLDYSMISSPQWSGILSPDGGVIKVEDVNEPIVLDVFLPAGKVAYLELKDFDSDGQVLSESGQFTASPSVYITFESGNIVSGVLQYYPSSHLYAGKDDWAISLGKADYDRQEVNIWFSSPGVYRYSSFDIVVEDDNAVIDQVRSLSAGACENILYDGNSIEGDVDMDLGGGYIFFRVPYSQGWTATVDGLPSTIEHANVAFMSVWVDAGHHNIILRYETPGLRIGIAMTLAGLSGTILIAYMFHRHRKKECQLRFE